jgi:hypothetical protein
MGDLLAQLDAGRPQLVHVGALGRRPLVQRHRVLVQPCLLLPPLGQLPVRRVLPAL